MNTKTAVLTFLEAYGKEILEKGKSFVIALSDGYCTIEKGIDDSPFMIKIDDYESGSAIKIDDYVSVTIEEFLGVKI